MSANDAARVTQTEFENKLVVDIKTEAAASATERTPFLVSDILTSTAEEEGSGIPMASATAAANGFEAAPAAEAASGVAEPEEAMAASGGAERNAGYAAAAVGSPGAGEDGGGGELGA